MDDIDAMHSEIDHLRTLAGMNTDARVLAAIEALIHELENRIARAESGTRRDVARLRSKRAPGHSPGQHPH